MTIENISLKFICVLFEFKHTAFFILREIIILGDQGVVSWVRSNGDESFQERAREPLGYYS